MKGLGATVKLTSFAAVLMLTTGPAVAANDTPVTPKGLNPPPRPEAMDALSLTELDQQMAWDDITSHVVKQPTPEGLQVKRGLVLPQKITIDPVPISAANKVPDLRPYHYAFLDNDELLIVNPFDRMVVSIIRKQNKKQQ